MEAGGRGNQLFWDYLLIDRTMWRKTACGIDGLSITQAISPLFATTWDELNAVDSGKKYWCKLGRTLSNTFMSLVCPEASASKAQDIHSLLTWFLIVWPAFSAAFNFDELMTKIDYNFQYFFCNMFVTACTVAVETKNLATITATLTWNVRIPLD